MIKVTGLKKHFGDLEVLKGIDQHIKQGEKVVVIGPSGSGKSTFLRCLNLLEVPTEGEILIEGESITAPKTNVNKIREKMGMVFQQFNLFPHLTVLDNITLAPIKVKKMPKAEAEKLARELLNKVGLADKEDSYPAQLSGGQQQRIAIARALAMQPDIMLFDEPTSALDPIAENEIYLQYNELTKGKTSIYISHRLASTRFCDRIIYLEQGKIIEEGSHDELIKLGGKYAYMYRVQSQYYMEKQNNEK